METIQKHEAWNKGKLVGQKPPLKPKDIWAIRIHLQNVHAMPCVIWLCSTWQSTASCEAVIWSAYGYETSAMERRSFLVPW